ncbi:MAG: transcription-repair coupling factor [Deltaproteobacteria bacterium]|nr:MAG: transcription-repair coupling factor [Deltaproteobacteria bacterium]
MQDERIQPLVDTMSWGGGRVETLVGRVRQGAKRISISGLHGGALSYTLSRLADVVSEHPVLVVTADPNRANQIYDDLSFFLAEQGQHSHSRVRYYASDEILPYSEMMPDRGAIQSRLRTLLQLQNNPPPIAVMPAAALVRRVMPREELSQRSDLVMMMEEIDQEEMLKRLVESGYRRVSVVEDRGTFAVRGGLIDLFAPLYNHPVRIELDDDIVASIRFFEPETQRTHHEVEELLIGPVDEAICTIETLRQARQRFADLADALEYSTLEVKQLLEDLGQGLRPFGIQRWVPGFYEQLDSIFDYLPKGTLIVMDEPHEIFVEIRRYGQRMQEEFEHLTQEGGFAFPPNEFLLSVEQVENKLSRFSRLEHQAVLTLPDAPAQEDGADGSKSSDDSVSKVAQFRIGASGVPELPFSTATHTSLKQQLQSRSPTEERRLQPLVDQIQYWLDEQLRVGIVCGSKGQALRLQELLRLYDVATYVWNDKADVDTMEKLMGRQAPVDLLMGRISEGFAFPQARLALLSEEEIFGPKARRRRSKKKPLAQTELESLKKGDLIIHKMYGMSRYGGLFTLTLGDETGDFMLLEFHGTDRLYLPITRLNQIDRYTGGGKPALDKLRGNSFEKKKSKARAAIQAMAGSLLQLYAERQAQKGNAFPSPGDAYHDFAARFPFEETPDQFQAIEDVLADLQSERCMDRLICGDVGYGKTEVAMRGAFHAAYNGKQVAVLVPTTVLAQQHGLNFIERFEGYPLKIGILSRFQTAKEKKELVKGLADGTVDIVVGTHRLLSKDIHFKDLGLLIVDEEHRFGVRHKERIKQFRKQVDVLTLTATPIPRTLEMSIAGIRDLTLIRTPPHDRLAIRTSIAPFDMQVIREAVMRELNRGGQVFFVHNRIESIGKIQSYLTNLIPESRIVVAHGQMPEAELERAMLDFVQGKFNILLCTSIIESGLDIPRANTIIVDRADAFGLAQLYQIRGRVGRGRERAYAVLLVPNNKRITPEAKERLQILQRFSDLGAGFEIARHDLELRGAGNLLGKEQSGHIHSVGMDLYLSMLEEAMAEIQDKPISERIEPEVKLGVDAYLPDHYVPDVQLRLQCYRRLTSADSTEELEDMYQEFCDRFGAPDPEVDNLFKVVEIQQTMSKMMATTGSISRNRFRLFFSPAAPIELDRILTLVQAKDAPFAMVPPTGLEMTEELSPGRDKLDDILHFLRQLEASIFETGGA